MKKIALRMPNWVGDVVMATPFLKGLRFHFPQAEISLFLRPYLIPVLRGASWFNHLRPLNDRGIFAPFQEGWRLKKEGFDGAFLLAHSWRAGLVFWTARIPQRIGYGSGGSGILLTHRAKVKKEEWEGRLRPIPMDLYYLRLLEVVGKPYKNRKLELPLSADKREWAREYLKNLGIQEGDLVIGLNPGAAFGASKLWPPEYFATLGDGLAQKYNAKILILCGPGEEPIAQAIHTSMKAPHFSTHQNIIPLSHLGAVIQQCSLLISTDSGPRHFATAFSVPLVVLAGPIHPGYTALEQKSMVFCREEVDCAPCHKKICPIDHRCMVRLTPEKVQGEVEKLLKKWVL